jgi:2-polyprenyl-6-methoxyphenol hydroxylase-like FAD-dependent oxidoreductase
MAKFNVKDLADNFSHYSSPIPQLIESTHESELIWSDIIDLKPISKFAFSRILLLGDAAHATTPNLGQGAGMAMEDALRVAEELDHFNNDVQKAFIACESKRLARTHFIVNTSYRLGKLAQEENQLLIKVRNALFRLTPAWVNERQMAKVLDI